jgi:hypothetical protein
LNNGPLSVNEACLQLITPWVCSLRLIAGGQGGYTIIQEDGMKKWSISSAVILCMMLGLSLCAAEQQAVKAVKTVKTGTVVNVSITNDGIRYSPKSPQTGLTMFVVTNKTNKSRGLVVSSVDPGGAPTFRYSAKIPA